MLISKNPTIEVHWDSKWLPHSQTLKWSLFQGYSFVVDEILASEMQQEGFVSEQPVPG